MPPMRRFPLLSYLSCTSRTNLQCRVAAMPTHFIACSSALCSLRLPQRPPCSLISSGGQRGQPAGWQRAATRRPRRPLAAAEADAPPPPPQQLLQPPLEAQASDSQLWSEVQLLAVRAQSLEASGGAEQAAAMLGAALERLERRHGPASLQLVALRQLLWDLLHTGARHDEALQQARRVHEAVAAQFGAASAEIQLVAVRLGISTAGACAARHAPPSRPQRDDRIRPCRTLCLHPLRVAWLAQPQAARHQSQAAGAGVRVAPHPPAAVTCCAPHPGPLRPMPAACGQLEEGIRLIYDATPVLQHNLGLMLRQAQQLAGQRQPGGGAADDGQEEVRAAWGGRQTPAAAAAAPAVAPAAGAAAAAFAAPAVAQPALPGWRLGRALRAR